MVLHNQTRKTLGIVIESIDNNNNNNNHKFRLLSLFNVFKDFPPYYRTTNKPIFTKLY